LPFFSPSAADGETVYIFKPSLVGAAWRFELTTDALEWQAGRRSGRFAYQDIRGIRLSYRPVSMQSRRFRADVFGPESMVRIVSVTWQTATLVAPQDAAYRRFVTNLHGRIKAAGGTPALESGLPRWLYRLGLGAMAVVVLAFAGLALRAVLTGSWAGLLFLAGFAALFGWQIGRFLQRNRPRRYSIDQLPPDLLP
jgi:hypothetical protein